MKVIPQNYEHHLKALNDKWIMERQRLDLELKGARGDEPDDCDAQVDAMDAGINDFALSLTAQNSSGSGRTSIPSHVK